MKQVKWGIIGLGNIALKFAEGFQYTKNAKLFAISSRNKNKLLTFKNKFQIGDNYCFTNYDNLLECKDLDIIYIALPNSFHHEWIIKSIDKGKNILVEKPATLSFAQMDSIKNNLKVCKISSSVSPSSAFGSLRIFFACPSMDSSSISTKIPCSLNDSVSTNDLIFPSSHSDSGPQ